MNFDARRSIVEKRRWAFGCVGNVLNDDDGNAMGLRLPNSLLDVGKDSVWIPQRELAIGEVVDLDVDDE